MDIDLRVEIAGVQFKNPILPGSAETAEDTETVKKMIAAGVGGVVTKTFTSMYEPTRRIRPYNFPLTTRMFGRGYSETGAFYTYACPHPRDMNITIEEEIPQMATLCREAGIPLVVSYFGRIEEINDWVNLGKRIEHAGADMIEIQFSCPQAKKPFEENPQLSADILKAVSSRLNIPVGPKVSPTIEPIEKLALMWEKAGASFLVAHNGVAGFVVDVEKESPFAIPAMGAYLTRALLPYSLARCVRIAKSVSIPVIGVTGIWSASDALQYMLTSCPAVQVCSAAYFRGFGIYSEIINGVAEWMSRKGYKTVKEFTGKCLPMIMSGDEVMAQAKHLSSMPPDTPYEPAVKIDKCTFCGRCSNVCYYGVYSINKKDKKFSIDGTKCWSCGWCIGICPKEALTLVDKKTREVIWEGKGLAVPFRETVDQELFAK